MCLFGALLVLFAFTYQKQKEKRKKEEIPSELFLQFDVLRKSFSFSLKEEVWGLCAPLRACFFAWEVGWKKILIIDQIMTRGLLSWKLFIEGKYGEVEGRWCSRKAIDRYGVRL